MEDIDISEQFLAAGTIDMSRQPIVPAARNCSEMLANWAPVQQDGRTTDGALGGGRALLVCIHFLMMWTPFHVAPGMGL